MAKNKEAPVGVKIISILYYIGAGLSVIGAILLFVGGSLFAGLLPGVLGGLLAVMGILFIGFAVLGFFIGRGLWRVQNWARIVAIIFAILGVLGAIYSIISGQFTAIVSLVIHGVIGGYLLFSEEVKQVFA